MIKPDLYHKSHHAIKQHVGKLIREFSNKFQWGNEDKDVFCDVGTGPGDFFVDHIYPLVKSKCKKIILADISKDMIDYCQKNFHISEKFEYKIFDIAAKSGVPAEVEGKIDHVTSMLVMHWVSDIRKALKNTFDLLSPNGGDCVIVFFAFNTIFNACNELSTSPKWYPYTRGEDNFMLTFENSKDCKAEFSEMMKAAGFENIRVDMESTVYDYETEEGLKGNKNGVAKDGYYNQTYVRADSN
ncbi:juvenile hormone acid O-methyltransferase-like [Stomoxys calcitrans]|uniref:juvenile hormone acid O-methyltransferase-like n=1 Tax=Stomoxys calcitrans TaxID=35570 RepID=UPI0027E24D53|nr:juvenile hormone acid O-methyltransferase-like [Stomoxys calcitrans]